MMAADYRHIGSLENRLGRHYSRFLAFWPAPALAGQSLALRKLCDAGSNRRSRVSVPIGYVWHREIGLGFDPDLQIREVRPIFARFRELGSARQAFLSMW